MVRGSTKGRGPVGPVGAHYSYGEGEPAELSTKGRHRLTIHMVRPGRVRVSLPNSRQRRGNVGGDEQLSFGGGAPKERPGGTRLRN